MERTTKDPPQKSSSVPSKMSMMENMQQHPYIVAGAGVALIVHLSALLSLPPAIRGRGAPFLPTTSKHGNAMFEQLHQQLAKSSTKTSSVLQQKVKQGKLHFVDLGSGDGRLVFRAAREGIFERSIGYEINPVLHTFAHLRRLVQAPQYWNSTQFLLRDIWNVNLQEVDVVAVYGLTPIMKPLGIKLQQELAPGSIVLSNVFSIPGWRPESTSSHGTHVYVVPPPIPSTSTVSTTTTNTAHNDNNLQHGDQLTKEALSSDKANLQQVKKLWLASQTKDTKS